jgi:hypothetical protein
MFLRSLPGSWSRSKESDNKVGVLILLKRDSEVIANLYVGMDWIAFEAADHRGPLPGAPRYEKKISASDRGRMMGYFAR